MHRTTRHAVAVVHDATAADRPVVRRESAALLGLRIRSALPRSAVSVRFERAQSAEGQPGARSAQPHAGRRSGAPHQRRPGAGAQLHQGVVRRQRSERGQHEESGQHVGEESGGGQSHGECFGGGSIRIMRIVLNVNSYVPSSNSVLS